MDRAQASTLASGKGSIVLDQSGSSPASQGDEWLARAASRLEAVGHGARVVLETTPNAVRGVEGVIGRAA